MSKAGNNEIQSINLTRYFWMLVVFWTIFVGSVLLWNLHDDKHGILKMAHINAASAFEKDIAYRAWVSSHGGVYVPVTEKTPPNPYLSQIEERDITTPSGRSLTLVNPAYMTRQVHELGSREYGLRGHITSLNLLRPENAPDLWEKDALEAFEQGATEVSSVKQFDGNAYMRLMRPLFVEQSCLKCHAKQGYKIGDIRGGISVSVPMAPLWSATRNHAVVHVLGHSFLWFLGMCGIGLGSRKLRHRIRKHEQAEQKIEEQNEFLNLVIDSLKHPFCVINANDYTIKMANSVASMDSMSEGQTCYSLTHNQNRPCQCLEHKCPVEEIKKTKQPVVVQHKHCDKDGNLRDMEVHAYPIFDNRGEVKQVIEYSLDITERKKTQEALRQSEEKFRSMFELSPYSTVLSDLKGNIIACNREFAKLHATKEGPEAQVGKNVSEFFPEEERLRLSSSLKNKSEGSKKLDQFEYTMLREDGTKFRAEAKSTVVLDKNGKPHALLATAHDITERRQAEDRLRESEERFKILFESAPDAYYIHDLDGHFIDGNKAGEQLIGYSKEEVIGDNFVNLDLIAGEDIPKELEAMADNKEGKAAGPLELTLYRKDGSRVMVETRSYPVEIGGQTVVLGIARDITERKKAEMALRESEQRLKILFESAPDAIYLCDMESNIVDGNKAAEKMVGYTKEELVEKSFAEAGLLSSEHLLRAFANLEKNAMGKPAGPDEFTLIRKDGGTVAVEIRSFPVSIGDQVLSLGIARDISARKKDEKKLFEYRAQLKSLASELSLAEERERHRLATDLHDHISQALVFSRIKLQELHASVSSAEIAGPLGDACDNLDRIIQDTRTLTFDLSSPILYELGFEAAVSEWLEEQIGQKHDIKTQFENDGLPKPLEDDIRILLFRNVRELLVNVFKHAEAQNVKVSISRISEEICVSVEDDGIGFNQAEVASKAGFGIFSIRERLEQLAGHIKIESEPGQGTKITMTAPLKCDEISRENKLKS